MKNAIFGIKTVKVSTQITLTTRVDPNRIAEKAVTRKEAIRLAQILCTVTATTQILTRIIALPATPEPILLLTSRRAMLIFAFRLCRTLIAADIVPFSSVIVLNEINYNMTKLINL